MNYWTATDEILGEHGGDAPVCPLCKQRMYAIDDHGRFGCGCPTRRSSLFGGFIFPEPKKKE